MWKLLRTVGKAVVEAAKYVSPPHIRYIADAVTALVDDDEAILEQQQQMQLAQMKLQYLQHQQGLALQAQLASLRHDKAEELQTFIELAETNRQQRSFRFQQWSLEQQKKLQLELLERNHQLQRELVIYQRQSSLQVIEEHKRIENLPIWLVASDILQSRIRSERIPLRVFLAPPKLQFDRFENGDNTAKDFPKIELTLAEGLRQFFRHYSNAKRDIDFLAGAWVSKSFHSEASIKALFNVLKSEPTLVLESEIDGDYLNFRIAYWGLNWSSYRYEPVISRLPYRDILNESARNRTRQWLKSREKLIQAGENPRIVDRVYGKDHAKNLLILKQEVTFKKAGLNPDNFTLNYILNKQDFENLFQFIIVYQCLFAGLVADEYFLLECNLSPLLPQLLPHLTENVNDSQTVEEMVEAVVIYYDDLYKNLERDRAVLIPDLRLDLAQSLSHLSNKNWSKREIIKSGRYWLQLRKIKLPKNTKPIEDLKAIIATIATALKAEDRDYVKQLNTCLAAIGEKIRLRESSLPEMWQPYKKPYSPNNIQTKLKTVSNPNPSQALPTRETAKFWQIATTLFGHASYVRCLAISKNGKLLASGSDDKTIKLWQLQTGQEIQTLRGHSHWVRSLGISSNQKTLISVSEDKTLKLWNLETGQELRSIDGIVGVANYIVISPDGQMLISNSGDNQINLWQLATGKKLYTLTANSPYIYSLAMSPNGNILAGGVQNHAITLWELKTGKEICTLTEHSKTVHALSFSPDSRTLVSGSADKTIKLWNLSTKQATNTLTGHTDIVYALAMSPNGNTLVSGSADKTIQVWRLSSSEY